ncbi:hypothetical protein HanPI659440_Chr00c29g0737071 [Helianthus annuus]|nr:hypothetical protein HanPI659440_Chr00c29g0737071 [Helianthus annuus]
MPDIHSLGPITPRSIGSNSYMETFPPPNSNEEIQTAENNILSSHDFLKPIR